MMNIIIASIISIISVLGFLKGIALTSDTLDNINKIIEKENN